VKIIGITGSIASGKTTVANLLAGKKYPLFSADMVVSKLYEKKSFNKILIQKFKLRRKEKIKDQIKLILRNKNILNKLETIIHPIVRKEMINFLKNKNKILFLEIPLLIENKLNKYFDKVIFIGAKKKLRLNRYLKKKGDRKMFSILENRQLSPILKKRICDHTINNNYSLSTLKKNVKNFLKTYE